ncbi:MAG: hypothetical protein M3Q86_05575 [Verrucomicrobiota bacterium]|nr:hypothetical protein [Verrucomicrobiota bacterium]
MEKRRLGLLSSSPFHQAHHVDLEKDASTALRFWLAADGSAAVGQALSHQEKKAQRRRFRCALVEEKN